jgi:hypothetical protein
MTIFGIRIARVSTLLFEKAVAVELAMQQQRRYDRIAYEQDHYWDFLVGQELVRQSEYCPGGRFHA